MVDDSIVRGNTTRQIVGMLREAGAQEVHLRISAPPIRFPCHYGVDMSTREEMVAHERTIDEIAEQLGADSLAYVSLDGVYEAVGTPGRGPLRRLLHRPLPARRGRRRQVRARAARDGPGRPLSLGSAPLRIAVLASGNGTNLQAILDRSTGTGPSRSWPSPPTSPARGRWSGRRRRGSRARVFERGDYADRAERDLAIADWLDGLGVELVVLAGYMQLLSGDFIARFRHRVINVHPALLPSFPGLDAIGQAIEHGVRVTGVTVHFVDEGVDTGPILMQRPVELTYTRPVAEVEEEIHRIEHELLPRAIELIAAGAVWIDPENPRLVRIEDEA